MQILHLLCTENKTQPNFFIMKKLFTLFAIASLTVAMVACGNKNKKATDEAATESAVEAAVETPAAPAAEESVLDKYEKLVNQAIEVYGKVKAGDANATAEYTKIAEEMSSMSTELTSAIANMSAEDADRFTKLGEKWAAALAQ